MSQHKTVFITFAAAAVVLGGWLLFASFANQPESVQAVAVSQPAPASAAQNPAPQATAVSASPTQVAPKKAASTDVDMPAYEENPLAEHEVVLRLAEVADQYADAIQYPTFSEPIADEQALQKYLPDRSFSTAMPLDPANPNSPRMVLMTDKTRYFTGEDILASVRVEGVEPGARVSVNGRLMVQGRVLLQVPAETTDNGESYGLGQSYGLVYALGSASGFAGGEMRVVAQVVIDGKSYELGTQVEYVAGMSTLTGVGSAEVRGEYLTIPVQVTTSSPGYHEVAANLYSVKSGQPLIHLDTQEELQTNNGVLYLRAHIRALKSKGDEGPYILKDISIMRMPAPPDFESSWGRSAQPSYPVNGFSFSEYNDTPYVDEEAQERLEFLRGLSSAP